MAKIAFLGLGAMGGRMAARLLTAGHDLSVWNRTAARTTDLASRGARVAATPAAAAEGRDIVFAMVRDDAAAADVWLYPALGWMGRAAARTAGPVPDPVLRWQAADGPIGRWQARFSALPGVADTWPPHWKS